MNERQTHRVWSFVRGLFIVLVSAIISNVFATALVLAWTGPSASAPNGNVAAPINVGPVDQIKDGNLGVNGLAVFGNTLLQGGSYLNFGATAGSGGYGIRDNSGLLEFKNSGGSWASIQSMISMLVSSTSQWTNGAGGAIYYNGGNVGIGTASPSQKLAVNGNISANGYFHASDARLKSNIITSPGLSIIERLRGVTFDWKNDRALSAGVIAQEVEQILPGAVHTDANGMKSVEYDQLIAPMIEAIKEQQEEIETLKRQIEELKAVSRR